MSRDMLIPGPSNQAFVTYSTSAEGGLVEHIICSDVPGDWMDIRRSSFILLYSYRSPSFLNLRNVAKTDLMSTAHSLHGCDR